MDDRVANSVVHARAIHKSRVPVTRFSTGGLRPDEQFEAWSNYLRPIADVSLTEPAPDGYAADFTTWNFGSMIFCDVSLPCDAPARNWRHAANPSGDHWYLALENAGQPADGPAGYLQRSMKFRSLARKHSGVTRSTSLVGLMIPRDLYTGMSVALDNVPEEIPDSGTGAMLADYVLTVRRHLNDLELADMPALAAATKAMISFCLAPSVDRAAIAKGPLLITNFERARQVIHRDLLSPQLDADYLCRTMGISRSRLYRLFDAVGGVNNYIRRQRLLAARNALSDLSDLRSISAIAFSVGFTDASGFSRAYQREFGCSPSDTRMEWLAGRAIALPPGPLPRTDGTSQLDHLLRQLRA